MFGAKGNKTVLLSLLAALLAVGAPAGKTYAGADSPTATKKAAPAGGDIVAVAGENKTIAITRSQLEQAIAGYKTTKSKDALTKAEIAGILEDLIRRRLLLQIDAVKAYRKDPAIIARVKDYEDTQIVSRWVEDQIRSKVQVSEQEIKAYYDQNRGEFRTPPRVKASYILLRSREEAQMVQKKLHDGQDFAKLAKQYSIDLPTGGRGGLIGTISESKKPSELGRVLFLLARGETSDIITTKAGYAIFKADKIYAPGFKPFNVAFNDIREKLFQKKAHDSFKQLVQNVEKNGAIKIDKEQLAAIEQTASNAPGPQEPQTAQAAAPVVAAK
ncbi:MAG: peptidyl-prolyl cis-trans isomerase [Syntrophobacteraceae bacterium]|nr:peptidyl-prolyl cis-trans isomerase [Syntrophobacteraceae bacterium]